MITFIVKKNGRKVCKAGVPEGGVLSAILSSNAEDQKLGQFPLKVGGMLRPQPGEPYCFSDWCRENLEVGDTISIRIVESDKCDEPIETQMDPPEKIVLREKKKSVRRMCKELGWQIVVPKKER